MLNNIKTFSQFNSLNEADENADFSATPEEGTEATAPAAPKEPKQLGGRDTTVSTYLQIGKKFLLELNTHIQYWFKYGEFSKKYEVTKTDPQAESLTFWCEDKSKDYTWKCVIYPDDSSTPTSSKVTDVSVEFNLYNSEEKLLRTATEKIAVKELSENQFARHFRKISKTVIKTPKNDNDRSKFKSREKSNLTDSIY